MTKLPMTDMIVLIPGILGSKLARNNVPVWDASLGNIVKQLAILGRDIQRLKLPLDLGDEHPKDGIEATGLITSTHHLPGVWSPATGYEGIVNWLHETFQLIEVKPGQRDKVGNFLPFWHDWRLSNRYNANLLKDEAETALRNWQAAGNPNAKLIFICHSMGGLIARYYLEVRGGAEHTRALITMGTPYRGALSALDKLANGASLSLGPIFTLSFTELARSLPSAYQLLPEYACIERGSDLAYVTEMRPFEEPYMQKMAEDARAFHEEIESAAKDRGDAWNYAIHPLVGIKQPTLVTARLAKRGVDCLGTYKGVDEEERGDGTVPRLSARPKEMAGDNASMTYCVEQHGSLITHGGLRDHLWGVLTARRKVYRDAPSGADLSLHLPEVHVADKPLEVTVTSPGHTNLLLTIDWLSSRGQSKPQVLRNLGGGTYSTIVDGLAPDLYRVRVGPPERKPGSAKPVNGHVLLWDPAEI